MVNVKGGLCNKFVVKIEKSSRAGIEPLTF